MIPSQQMKQIESRITNMQQRPKVGVFIDLDGVLADDDARQDATIAEASRTFASTVGRFCSGTVYYSMDIVRNDGIDNKAWNSKTFHKVLTHNEGFTNDSVNLDILFDVHAAALRKQFDTIMLVVGTTNYNTLAQRLIHDGIAVIMVSNYPKEKRVLPRDSCVYIPIHTLFSSTPEDEYSTAVSFDPETFDYSSLIRVLATSENMMPFVAVGYFVKRVMWRLGEEFAEVRLCHKLFQTAKERDIIEVYERENINRNGNMVSACKLNQAHPLVREVMDDLEEATTPNNDGVQVTVDTNDSRTSPTEESVTLYPNV